MCSFQRQRNDWYLKHLLWNCPQLMPLDLTNYISILIQVMAKGAFRHKIKQYMFMQMFTWMQWSGCPSHNMIFQDFFNTLRHWDKMDTISQMTFSNAFSWKKMFEYRLKFQWSLFLRVQLTISQALVQIMAWRRPGDKPLSEPMMARLPMHICFTRPQWIKPFTIKIQIYL